MGKKRQNKKDIRFKTELSEKIGEATNLSIRNSIAVLTRTFEVNPTITPEELEAIVATLVGASARTILGQVFTILAERTLLQYDGDPEELKQYVVDLNEVEFETKPKEPGKKLLW